MARPFDITSRGSSQLRECFLKWLERDDLASVTMLPELACVLPAVRSNVDRHGDTVEASDNAGRERSVTRDLEAHAVREPLRSLREHATRSVELEALQRSKGAPPSEDRGKRHEDDADVPSE